MTWIRRHPGVSRIVIMIVTAVVVAAILSVGRASAEAPPSVIEGQPSPLRFEASEFHEEIDQEATELERGLARINTQAVYEENIGTSNAVRGRVESFFAAVRLAGRPVAVEPPETTTTSSTTTSTTEVPPDGEEPVETTTTTSTTTTTLPPQPPPIEEQLAQVSEEFVELPPGTVELFVRLFNEDPARIQEGGEAVFGRIQEEALRITNDELEKQITNQDIVEVRRTLLSQPPFVNVAGLAEEDRLAVQRGIAEIVADSLLPNSEVNQDLTSQLEEQNAAAVPEVKQSWQPGEVIVEDGEVVDKLELQAIESLGLIQAPAETNVAGIAAIGALAVLLTAFLVWRIAPSQWSQPKYFVLLGLLLAFAAGAARLPEFIALDSVELGYLIPAAAIGFLGAILYDPRTAVFLSIPMGMFTAVTTGEVAFTVYAVAATLAPVPFVSSVSSRRDLRFAVALSALALAPVAAAISWFFQASDVMPLDVVLPAAGYAAAGGLIAGVVAQGFLPYLENLFRVTTTLSLLDLTDRNHPALRALEERAPGTFNHSILVGTLAGKAARAIGADALLAQAAAYYHDLGKTVEPHFFIENQFGVSNPHDDMEPEDSAAIIRDHVTHGLDLAKQYRIPPDVAEGIRMHHGNGLMRYFYHKAIAASPGIDAKPFRHNGEKPRRKEMAILMLSDSVEGAARALAQEEDPTPDSLRKLVDQIVAEKLEDGQLDESELTFGDLTKVKESLVEALTGYYHTRIAYPGFPGSDR